MCAIKEVRVITDDKTSKECLKQLNQVSFPYLFHSIVVHGANLLSGFLFALKSFLCCCFGIWQFEFFFNATYHLHLYNVSYCQQEITLLSQLSHPNIVQYYGSELV